MEFSSDDFKSRLHKAAEKKLNAKFLADSAPECSFLIRPPGSDSFINGIGAAQLKPHKSNSDGGARSLSPSPIRTVLQRASNEPVSTIDSPDFTASHTIGDGVKSYGSVILANSINNSSRYAWTFENNSGAAPERNGTAQFIPPNTKSWDDLRGIMKVRLGTGALLDSAPVRRPFASKSESPELSTPNANNSWLYDLSAPDRTTKSYMRNTLLSENRRQAHTERIRQRGEPANWPWWKQKPLQPDEPIPVPLSANDPTYSPEVVSCHLFKDLRAGPS